MSNRSTSHVNFGSASVSIVICTFGNTTDLLATLNSINEARVPDNLIAELIIVDNSPTYEMRHVLQTSVDLCPRLRLRVLHEPRRGKVYALNTAIAATESIAMLFTDDDVRVPPDWIEAMVHPILAGNADAVAGGVHLAPDLCRPWMEPLHRGWMASTEVIDPKRPEALIGANMALSRRVFERVPMFDPELGPGSALGSGEESLFSLQLYQAGFRIVSAFDTSVEHRFSASRLSKQSLLNRARIEGRIAAYISWHWEHASLRHPYRQLLGQWLRLQKKRWTRPRWTSSEGAPTWELLHLLRIHFIQQYLRERRRPAIYSKRGLVKTDYANPAVTSRRRL